MPELNGKPTPDDHDDEVLARIVAEIAERIEQGEPVDQEAYLRRHPEYAERLRSLWPALVAATGLRPPESPVGISIDRPSSEIDGSSEGGNDRLGDFRLIREIGRGGMGIVYEAEQTSLRRRVALKVLTAAGSIDDRQLQRFGIEARAAAALHHANIVPVFAVGTERRVPFYAMQFIEGISLATVIAEMRKLGGLEQPGLETACALTRSLLAGHLGATLSGGSTVEIVGPRPRMTLSYAAGPTPVPSQSRARAHGFMREVAALGVQAAAALEHAHEHGILHRDVKPSNLLVNEAGHLWVTDFGVARVQGESNLTQTGDMLGTLRYMSPESAAGGGRRVIVDGRTDIYSLGVTLYELLTLRPAFSGDDRVEVLRQIARDEPTPPRKLDPTIPVDLETIVLKAMAKAPADRYATAADFAADLERLLENRPILARRPALAERGAKWIRRQRGLVFSLAGAACVIALSLASAGWYYTSLLRNQNVALQAAVANAEEQTKEASRQRSLADRHYFAAQLQLASRAIDARQFDVAQDLLDAVAPGPRSGSIGEFAWDYLRGLARRELVRLPERAAQLKEMAISGDGRLAAAWYSDEKIELWDIASERSVQTFGPVKCRNLVLSEDGRILAAEQVGAGENVSRQITVWQATTGHVLGRYAMDLGPQAHRSRLHLFAGGRLVASRWCQADAKMSLRIHRIEFDSKLAPEVPVVSISGLDDVSVPAGADFFVARERGRLRIRDGFTGVAQKELPGTYPLASALATSNDGRYLAVAPDGDPVVIFNLVTGEEEGRHSFGTRVPVVLLSPDGYVVCGVDCSGIVHLWDRSNGRSHFVTPDDLGGQRIAIHYPAFSQDGRRLATSTMHKSGGAVPTAVWDVESGRRLGVFPGADNWTKPFLFSRDGRALIASGSRSPRIWHFDPVAECLTPAGHKDEAWAAAYSPDGHLLATGSDDTDEPQTIKLWDPSTGKLLRSWNGGVGTVASLAFSPDGQTLASGHLILGDNVRLWEVRSGRLLQTLKDHKDVVRSIAFAPDGRTLATAGGLKAEAGEDWAIHVWDVAAAICVRRLEGHSDVVRSLAFSPDGKTLATASNDTTVRIWQAGTGRLLNMQLTSSQLVALAFAPDGGTIMVADDSGLVTIRDASNLAVLRSIRGPSDKLLDLAVAPDGRSVATCGISGKIRLWDTLTGQELLTLEGHKTQVNGIAFAPDGSSLASCSHDGKVRLWRTGSTEPR
jgi:WD40 repeat protein/serine/threonine protein kinase